MFQEDTAKDGREERRWREMSELALFVGAGAAEGSADGGDDDWIACVHCVVGGWLREGRLLGDGCSSC